MGDKKKKSQLPEELQDLANARAIYNKLKADDIVPFKSGVDASDFLRHEIDRMSKDDKMNNAYKAYREGHGYKDKEYKGIDLSALAGGNASAGEVSQTFKEIRKKFPDEKAALYTPNPEALLRARDDNPVKAGDRIISEATFAGIETLNPDVLAGIVAMCDATGFNEGKYCKAAQAVYNRSQINPHPKSSRGK